MWTIYRCSEGILWNIYRCNLGILSRLIFILWTMCFYAVFLVCSYSSTCFFCHLIPKKGFFDICTSSYHALTCDYREFHSCIALCGGSWAVLTAEASSVDQSCVQQGEAFARQPSTSDSAPERQQWNQHPMCHPLGCVSVSVKTQQLLTVSKELDEKEGAGPGSKPEGFLPRGN